MAGWVTNSYINIVYIVLIQDTFAVQIAKILLPNPSDLHALTPSWYDNRRGAQEEEESAIRRAGLCDVVFVWKWLHTQVGQLSPVRQLSCKDKWKLSQLSYWDRWNWYFCLIGTNGFESTVVLRQMELTQLSYWHNCRIVPNGIESTVVEPTVIEPTVVKPPVVLPDVMASCGCLLWLSHLWLDLLPFSPLLFLPFNIHFWGKWGF